MVVSPLKPSTKRIVWSIYFSSRLLLKVLRCTGSTLRYLTSADNNRNKQTPVNMGFLLDVPQGMSVLMFFSFLEKPLIVFPPFFSPQKRRLRSKNCTLPSSGFGWLRLRMLREAVRRSLQRRNIRRTVARRHLCGASDACRAPRVRDKLPPPTSFFVNSRTLMGCTDRLRMGVGAAHQCPLGSVANYLIHADVRPFR